MGHIFKEFFGQTVYQYYKDARLLAAYHDIINTQKTFTEIAYEYGYTDVYHFSKNIKSAYKLTPSELRK